MSDCLADLKRSMRDIAIYDRMLSVCGPSIVADLLRKHPELRAVRDQWVAVIMENFDGIL